MKNSDEFAIILDDLVEVLHLQAKELENLIAHVEQVTRKMPEESRMSVVRSSLTGLHHRIRKLRGIEHRVPK